MTTLTEQLEFIRATRRSWQVSFRKMVNERRMKPEVADGKLAKIADVEATIEKLKLLEEVSEEMKAKSPNRRSQRGRDAEATNATETRIRPSLK